MREIGDLLRVFEEGNWDFDDGELTVLLEFYQRVRADVGQLYCTNDKWGLFFNEIVEDQASLKRCAEYRRMGVIRG